MATQLARPRPEDFGLSEDDLGRTSRPFLGEHRCGLLLTLVAASILALFGLVYLGSGSLAAAAFFAAVLGVASLVLALPALMLALSAACAAERRWRERRDPCYRACAAYRAALAEFERRTAAHRDAHASRVAPQRSDPTAFRAEVARRLRGRGWDEVLSLDREISGADLLARGVDRSLAVRCVPGPERADLADARELVAARLDLQATSALLISAPVVEAPVRAYFEEHGIDVEETAGKF